MRQDLTKVIFDGHSAHSFKRSKSGEHHVVRKAKKFKLDEDLEVVDDFSRSCIGVRCTRLSADWDSGDWNISWRLLRKVISAQVGRPWVEVYGEIQKVSHWYIRRELLEEVNSKTYWEDGVVKCHTFFGSDEKPSGLHVNPLDGILDNTPRGWRRRSFHDREAFKAMERAKICRSTSIQGQYYVKYREQWYLVKTVPWNSPEATTPFGKVVDTLVSADVNNRGLHSRIDPYLVYGDDVIGIEKRQLSKREKRRHGLT